MFWSGIDLFLNQGMRFGISVMLARLLDPEVFGTIALLSLFLGVAMLFVDAGFSAALIQKQDTTHADESTVFWFNFGAGLFITVVLCGLAPWIAKFFDVPVLVTLTMLMACNILFSAMGSIHQTLMIKHLDFRTLMKIGVISTLFSGGVGVYLAWANYGVWSLACQAVTGTLCRTVLLWCVHSWRPLFTFSRDSFRRLFGFSGYIFAAGLLTVISDNVYSLLIGKFFSVRELGFYTRANSTQRLIVELPINVVSRVTFPLYSSLNQDVDRLRRAVRMSIRSIMLVTSPTMFGLAILSGPFIQNIFGDRWLPAAPILQVLCVVGLCLPIQHVNVSVLKSMGHADLNFRINIVKKVTGISCLTIGSFFGVMGVAWGVVVQSFIATIINGYYTHKKLDYGTREQVKDCIPSLLLSAMMAVVVAMADIWVNIGGIIELALLTLLGASFYLAGNALLGVSAFRESISFIRGTAKA